MDFPPSPFWSFSLAFYSKPGVAEACLALQDRHGIDVNLLLAAVFAGTTGIALGAAEWARLTSEVRLCQEYVIVGLRDARQVLKLLGARWPVAEQLYSPVKASELDAEHLEQLMIEAALPPPAAAPDSELARANIMAYLAYCGVALDEDDWADVGRILAAAIPPSR
jgi:uncharacterized protein (TIGR02444 family)